MKFFSSSTSGVHSEFHVEKKIFNQFEKSKINCFNQLEKKKKIHLSRYYINKHILRKWFSEGE